MNEETAPSASEKFKSTIENAIRSTPMNVQDRLIPVNDSIEKMAKAKPTREMSLAHDSYLKAVDELIRWESEIKNLFLK